MATQEPPESGSRIGSGPAFPQRNAFVLQFAAGTSPEPGLIRGRIHHVASGQLAAFESLDELWAFVSRTLFGPNGASSPSTADG